MVLHKSVNLLISVIIPHWSVAWEGSGGPSPSKASYFGGIRCAQQLSMIDCKPKTVLTAHPWPEGRGLGGACGHIKAYGSYRHAIWYYMLGTGIDFVSAMAIYSVRLVFICDLYSLYKYDSCMYVCVHGCMDNAVWSRHMYHVLCTM